MQESWGPVGHATLMEGHQPPHNNFSVYLFICTAQVRGWLGSEEVSVGSSPSCEHSGSSS